MTDSGDGQLPRQGTNRWVVVCREAVAIVKSRNFRASVVVFMALMVLFSADAFANFDRTAMYSKLEWIGFAWERVPWALAGMVPLWLLGRRARLVYVTLCPAFAVIVIVQNFVRANFDMVLTGSWVGIVCLSNPDEMSQFLGQYAVELAFCLLAAVLSVVGLVWILSVAVRNARATRLSVVSAVLAVGLFAFWAGRAQNNAKTSMFMGWAYWQPSVYCVGDSVRNCVLQRRLANMAKSPALPETLHAADDREVVGVFVLGESATRNHWGLYGYSRDTTPQLSAIRDELAVFDDLVTTSSSTGEAMRGVFSTRTLESPWDVRYAMPQALAKCGFGVSLFSNQERWNSWGSDESFSFAGCDPFVVMREQGETNRYDEALLPYLDGALAKGVGRKVVFLHFIGSHTPCERLCPTKSAPFGADAAAPVGGRHALSVDDYDSSIWYTDRLLGEVVRKLKALGKPAWMIYLSDHGETPSAKSWRTATDPDLWEVPFVVWTSDSFDAAFPERVAALRRAQTRPLQSDQLLYGLLRFMGVEGLGVAPQEDFLNDAFAPRRPRLVQNGQIPYQGRAK